MKEFLNYVAEDILQKYGNDLSRIAVVFPNKRASLFLNDHLARLAGRAMWSPAYMTISDLFRHHSPLQVADPVKLVCDLYKCFTELTETDETLDHFYGWGQLLLADFDDMDKNMADARQVFANVRDLHELDGVDYLTEEQKDVLRRFFSNFTDEHTSELKKRFLKLWSRMENIYTAFNERLASQGLAYEGALYRQVALSEAIDFDYDCYLFVGFNMLQQVEQRLFTTLRKAGKAKFYWDFDHYYMPSKASGLAPGRNEAGHFIAQYLSDFPNELDIDDDAIYRQFSQPKNITYISAATEDIQARYISRWLEQHSRYQDGRRTAIVLCNEALLPTAIHSLPEQVASVNITTGYPLAQSPVASFIGLLFTLHTSGFDASRELYRLHHVANVLRHPYAGFVSAKSTGLLQELSKRHLYYPSRSVLCVDEGTTLLFGTQTDSNVQLLEWICSILQLIARTGNAASDPLYQESVFRAYGLTNRLKSLVESGSLTIDVITLQRLLGQLIATTSIPFHGEPAEGIQIMGVLETRNLDFDHVLLLSCNEGNMPRGVNDNSFIPYSIRKAYGLTTIDHKVSIYAYYFHRLLQRASDVTILYNNSTVDGNKGEMSRFMLQLMVESPHTIAFKTLQAGQHLQHMQYPVVQKSGEVMELLLNRFSAERNTPSAGRPLLTPTAVNRYLSCPLKFYYCYVCNLREQVADDESIDNRVFGNIFHEASRIVYQQLSQRHQPILASHIGDFLKIPANVGRAVDEAIRTELFKTERMLPLNGLQLISREVIIHYLQLLLRQDARHAPFSIVGLECDVVQPIVVDNARQRFTTTIGGRIDRLDCITEATDNGRQAETIRVVDYKTGSRLPQALPDVEAIFLPENVSRHSDYYLQTMLYASIVRQSASYNPRQLPVSPALLFIQHSSADPVLCIGKERLSDIATKQAAFTQLLNEKIKEIFNPDIAFAPTTERSQCLNCPYKELCRMPV